MPRRTRNTNDLYYITLTIVDWIDLFTRVEYKGLIIENLKHCQERKNLELYAYVLMTNHLHMICSCRKHPLSDILRDFKTFTSKELMKMIIDLPMESRRDWLVKSFRGAGKKSPQNKNFKIWQRGNYPFLLYSNKMIDQKLDYIHNNPVAAGIVNEPYEYLYSSASPLSPLKVLPL